METSMKNKIEHNGIDGALLTIYSVILGLYFTLYKDPFSKLNVCRIIEFTGFISLLIVAAIVIPAIRMYFIKPDLNVVKHELCLVFLSFILVVYLENRYANEVIFRNYLNFYIILLLAWMGITIFLSMINCKIPQDNKEND